jgi:putative flippase GtrA
VKSAARFGRYFIAGGVAASFDIGLFLLLIRVGHSVQFSGTVSFIVATLVNFFLSRHFVFPDRQGDGMQKIVATYAVSLVGLALNQLILWLGIEHLHLMPLAAKLAATGIVFFWNYLIRNYYVFRK